MANTDDVTWIDQSDFDLILFFLGIAYAGIDAEDDETREELNDLRRRLSGWKESQDIEDDDEGEGSIEVVTIGPDTPNR